MTTLAEKIQAKLELEVQIRKLSKQLNEMRLDIDKDVTALVEAKEP